MIEWLSKIFSVSQFSTIWDVIGLIADVFGIVGLAITIYQIGQVKDKVNSSVQSMNELRRLQEQARLKEIFNDLCKQQEELGWLISKTGQIGYNREMFSNKTSEIISSMNRCLSELQSKHAEISDPLRSAVLELRKYDEGEKKPLVEAEGYLYSAMQALKTIDEQYTTGNINTIAHSK